MGPDMPGYGLLTEPPEYDIESKCCVVCGEEEDDCSCEDGFVLPKPPCTDCPPWIHCKGRKTGECPPEDDERD